ncbi:GNAT family N-acetyltransferase [Microbacterium sp. ARD31]|uniref:GNAT family N-acetyltransferase n=1 Tax=Microbacterium sp. ARD31 TaxID=2962576 RepID=UPI00288239DB|nr:GNAT family N-acetyltransferase [Microbacterium sp. ARD31]MDT0184973.1 GNAT family N-acetyltransferase [Microbacterium sp. ARD31]
MTTYEYRRLTEDDVEAHRRLGREAFGHPASAPADTPAPPPRPGATRWGAFLGEELVARVEGFALGSWFGGRVLPTVGIGGVVVAPEHRGRGVSRGLVTQVLDHHRAQGAALSTLYPTAPGYYRGLGYEVIGSYDEVVVPSAALATMAPGPPGLRTRRATTADGPGLRNVYDAWAAAQNGPLDRRGPAFAVADDDWVADHEAVTVVEDEQGVVRGFASWDRGTGYGAAAHLSVAEVLAVDADSYRALWHVIGSFAAVVGEVRLLTSGADVARYALHTKDWKVTLEDVYMLRVEDVPTALSGIRLPFEVSVPFVVTDPLGVIDGSYLLTTDAGTTSCRRSEDGAGAELTARGLALCLAGTQSCANLRSAGLLAGPSTWDPLLDHALGGRQVHVRDYF